MNTKANTNNKMRRAVMTLLLAIFTVTAWAQVKYIERSWNSTNKVVTSTEYDCNTYTELSGTDASRALTLESGKYYVVRGADVRYKRLIAPYNNAAYLILCDGAKLTAQITINQYQYLTIYAQSGGTGQLVANGSIIQRAEPRSVPSAPTSSSTVSRLAPPSTESAPSCSTWTTRT